jgi:hypothetical protein
MPRMVKIRVLPGLWIAWCEDDFGLMSHVRRGFSPEHALTRTTRSLLKGDSYA